MMNSSKKPLFQLKDLLAAMLVGLISLSLYVWNPPVLRHMESRVLDWSFMLRGALEMPASDVAIVSIDDASIASEGHWPWPRSRVADLISKLSDDYHTGSIVTDILFTQRERSMTEEIRRWMIEHGHGDADYLSALESHLAGDEKLAQALHDCHQVVEGFYFLQNPDISIYDASEQANELERISASVIEAVDDRAGRKNRISRVPGLLSNIPSLADSALGGFINLIPDDDGAIRDVPLLVRYRNAYLPSLSLAAARRHLGDPPLRVQVGADATHISLADQTIEADPKSRVWINYYGPSGSVKHYSATDVLNGKVPVDALKGRMVFLGVEASNHFDERQTPFDNRMSGIEIHAQLAMNLLHDQVLHRPIWLQHFEMAMIFVVMFGYGLLFYRVIARSHGIGTLVLLGLWMLLGYQLFLNGIWLHGVLIGLQTLVTFAVLYSLNLALVLHERRRMRESFARYVDPHIVGEVIDHQDELGLHGEEREISVLFLDIEGFTTFSERLPATEVVEHLNGFFDAVMPIIHDHHGCIDRLTGDGLIALFGAPLMDAEHALHAGCAALEAEKALAPLQPVFERLGHPLRMRVGINSGFMVVGSVGSHERLQYTFMGDPGNAAARLESLNKVYNSSCLIGERTYQLIGGRLLCREIDEVVLAGKSKPLRVFELLGSGEGTQEMIANNRIFAKALNLYRRGDFSEAAALFGTIAESDAVARSLQARCIAFASKPPEGWNGVWVAEGK